MLNEWLVCFPILLNVCKREWEIVWKSCCSSYELKLELSDLKFKNFCEKNIIESKMYRNLVYNEYKEYKGYLYKGY